MQKLQWAFTLVEATLKVRERVGNGCAFINRVIGVKTNKIAECCDPFKVYSDMSSKDT